MGTNMHKQPTRYGPLVHATDVHEGRLNMVQVGQKILKMAEHR